MDEGSFAAAEDAAMMDLTNALQAFDWKEGVVGRAKRQLFSACPDENVKGVQALKAMLCIGREEVYEVAQEVIDSGVVARLVEFLQTGGRELKWPASFCLTNVAAGRDEQTDAVVQAGTVPVMVEILRSPDALLRRQALFCLANIAGSAIWHRQLLAKHPDYVRSLFVASKLTADPKVKSLVCWNFRNMCLLGGAPVSVMEAGLDFFVESIWPFWEDRAWFSCMRFCCETLATCSRDPVLRTYLAQRHMGILPDLVRCLLNHNNANSNSVEHVLETAMWLACEATEEQKLTLLPLSGVVEKLGPMGNGNKGGNCQEFSIRLLATLCGSSITPNRIVTDLVMNYHEILLTLPAQIFKGTVPAATQTVREFSALLFVRAASQAAFVEKLFTVLVTEPSVTEMLLDILDFASFGLRESYGGKYQEDYEVLLIETLRLLLVNLEQGAVLQTRHGMQMNAAASALTAHEGPERIRCALAGSFGEVEILVQKLLLVLQQTGGC